MPKIDHRQRLSARQAFQALRKLQAQPIAKKIARAQKIIRAALDAGATAIAFSGGRDSIVLADVAATVDPTLPLIWANTGIADPRLVDYVREYGGDRLVEVHAPQHPEKTWQEKPCLPIGAKVSTSAYRRDNPELRINPSNCCRFHKAGPISSEAKRRGLAALCFGARGDDSNRHRFKLSTGEIFPDKHGYLIAFPLLTWTQADALEYVAQHRPEYPLQYGTSEELGCLGCAIALARWPNDLALLRRKDPERHRRLIVDAGFGLEILKIKYGLTHAGAEALAARETWPRLIESGALDRIPNPRKGRR